MLIFRHKFPGERSEEQSCSLLLPHSVRLVLTALSQDTASPPEHAGTAQPPPGTHGGAQGWGGVVGRTTQVPLDSRP